MQRRPAPCARTVPENDARRPRRRLRASAGRFGLFVSKLTPCLGELSREFHLRTLVRDASSAVAAFGCDLRMGPLSYENLEGENTVCLSTHALTGFQLMVSSFKLGDEISSSKTWSKRFAFLEDISHLLANQSAFFQVDSLWTLMDTCATSTGRRSFSRSTVYSGVNSVRDVSGNPRYFRVSKPLRIARVKKSGRADICHKAADLPTEPAASEARDRRHSSGRGVAVDAL